MRPAKLAALLLLPALAVVLALLESPATGTGQSNLKECPVALSRALGGSPAEVSLGTDGKLWFTELVENQIGSLDPTTLRLQEFPVSAGTSPHGMREGPDGAFYFAGLSDRIGRLDPVTGNVQIFTKGISPGAQTQHIAFAPGDPGHLYFSEFAGGRLGRMDLKTHQIQEYSQGLPPHNEIHYLVIGPDGQIWATMQGADELVRFNVQTQTFDRFVKFPKGSQPHILRLSADGVFFVSLQKASKLGEYDPRTGHISVYPTSLSQPASTALFSTDPRLVDIQPTADGRTVWISTESPTMYRFDRSSKTMTACHVTGAPFIGAISAPPAPTTPLTFALDRSNRVWVTDLEGKRMILLKQ